ncbi:MAG TPA: MlaD family protein, partial [Paludibacteraceae bacterium]|nr:MlaD family protein [Paludibacteraceae bacterium]
LSVGNNVRFAGINVGTVKDIRIISDTSVIVTFSVDDRYTKYIYKNSTVQIGQEGLMGGKIVLILPGDPQTGRVREGDFLKVTEGLDIQGMLAQAQIMLEEATGTVANLRSITGKIDSGKGDMGNLINNDSLTTQLNIAMNNINSSLAHIKQLTSKVDSGQGDLGKLVNDDKLTTKLNNILGKGDSIMYELHTTTYALNHGEGTLPRLVHDKQMAQNIDTAISKVDEAVVQVTRAAETVANSWIFRLFSKKKKEPKEQPVQEFNVQPGDTIVIDSIGASLKR